MFFNLLAEADFSSIFTLASLQVVLALIVIEGLLSVDNALAIAALASHLDEKKRKIAISVGYAGAYGFRILALFLASYIINNHWLMALGAGYLIWLMCNHFAESEDSDADSDGHKAPPSFAKTIALIAFLDLSLSFDNVVAAVAFARDNIILVYVGVTIGIITLRLVAGYCIKLLDKHPWLEHTAFLLVGFVGAMLCAELYWDSYVRKDFNIMGYDLIHGEASVDAPVAGKSIEVANGKDVAAASPDEVNKVASEPKEEVAHILVDPDSLHYHIKKPVKFGGIFLIVIGHLTYEKYPAVKLAMRPFVIAFRHVFALFARAINFVFGIVTFPIRMLFKPKRQEA
jgi:YkoY family integral membrane protein